MEYFSANLISNMVLSRRSNDDSKTDRGFIPVGSKTLFFFMGRLLVDVPVLNEMFWFVTDAEKLRRYLIVQDFTIAATDRFKHKKSLTVYKPLECCFSEDRITLTEANPEEVTTYRATRVWRGRISKLSEDFEKIA